MLAQQLPEAGGRPTTRRPASDLVSPAASVRLDPLRTPAGRAFPTGATAPVRDKSADVGSLGCARSPASRSTSAQVSPSTSPCLRPSARAIAHRTPFGCAAGGLDECSHLIDRVRLDRFHLNPRWSGQRSDVSRDVTAPMRLAQRGADRSMNLMRPPGTATVGDDLPVQQLQVLRFESIQAMLADPGDQMPPDRDPVRRVAGLPNIRPSDVLQPVIQPFRHSPPLARPTDLALVPLAFQVADLLDHARPWSCP